MERIVWEKEKTPREFSTPLSFLTKATWADAVVACNKLYDIRLFADLRYPAGRLHEDEFVIHYLLDRAKKLVYTNEPLYAYVQAEDSITHNKDAKNFQDAYTALFDRIVFLREKGMSEDAREWEKRTLKHLTDYYRAMEKKPDGIFWQPIWRQRILQFLREFSLSPDSFGASLAEKIRKVMPPEETGP